ncbi:hypothetical protein [Sphingomonas oligophenolica]
MDMGWMVPVGVVAAISARGAFSTWVRAKHGYPLENENGRRSRRSRDGIPPETDRTVTLLTNENERLTGQVSRLEERIAVLERIATDPAERTAREIEALRDR